MIFFVTLPGGLVFCVPGQYRVFPPLAAIIAASLRGILATRRWRRCRGSAPIYPAGPGEAHQDSEADCSKSWLLGPIHPKDVLWGYSRAILEAAPSLWHCPAVGNRGLPQRDEEWRCHRDSGSCPRNNAWQMALRCFAKCPYRAHRRDIRQGAQEGIWHYCGKLPIRGPNHHHLGPYEPGTLAGSAHQVNGVP